MLYSITKRVYHGMVGHEYDEYVILFSTVDDSVSIIHVGTFWDGMPSTVNPNDRRYS